MADTNKISQALFEAGADAMDNLFNVLIKFPGEEGFTSMTVRSGDFEPPASKNETYSREALGVKINLPSTKASYERTFSIDFTIDGTYTNFMRFKAWKAAVDNELSNSKGNFPMSLGEIRVEAVKTWVSGLDDPDYNMVEQVKEGIKQDGLKEGGNSKYQVWHYKSVWVSEVTNPGYKRAGGASMTCKVTFQFVEDESNSMPGYFNS